MIVSLVSGGRCSGPEPELGLLHRQAEVFWVQGAGVDLQRMLSAAGWVPRLRAHADRLKTSGAGKALVHGQV